MTVRLEYCFNTITNKDQPGLPDNFGFSDCPEAGTKIFSNQLTSLYDYSPICVLKYRPGLRDIMDPTGYPITLQAAVLYRRGDRNTEPFIRCLRDNGKHIKMTSECTSSFLVAATVI